MYEEIKGKRVTKGQGRIGQDRIREKRGKEKLLRR